MKESDRGKNKARDSAKKMHITILAMKDKQTNKRDETKKKKQENRIP